VSRPDKYRMLGEKARRESPAIEGLLQYDLLGQENWQEYRYETTATSNIDPGVKHTFQLPINARVHNVWIAAGAFWHFSASDHWAMQGRLVFYRGNSPVGIYYFSDTDQNGPNIAGIASDAPRKLVRHAADGQGSPLPVLKYQEVSSTSAQRDNLDMSVIPFPIKANRMDYVLDYGRAIIATPSGPIWLLTGCRVLSTF
jgi:hypothetical protein